MNMADSLPEAEDNAVVAAGFFSTPELNQRLDLLRHLAENSDLVPLVKGPPGAGKTTLVYRFQSLASPNWLICRIDANPMMHPDQLLSRLAGCFQVIEEDDRLLEHLTRRLETLRQEGGLPLILVDDADQLPPATLITLLRLQERRFAGEPLTSLLLFAAPVMDQVFATPQLQVMNLQVIHSLELPRLSEDQIAPFVRHQLVAEGYAGELPLDSLRLKRLFEETGGLPGAVNDRLLSAVRRSVSPRRPSRRGDLLRAHSAMTWAGVVATVIVVLLMLGFQDQINNLFTPGIPREEPLALPPVQPSPAGPVVETQPLSPRPMPEEDSRLRPAETPAEPPLPAITATPFKASEPQPPPPPVPEAGRSASSEPLAPQPVAENIEATVRPLTVSEKVASTASETPVSTTGESARTGESESTALVNRGQSLPPSDVARDLPGAAERRLEPEPAKPGSKLQSTARAPGLRDDRWPLRQNPNHYSLQLLGVATEASFGDFVKQHDLAGKAVAVRVRRRGRPWYILLYGDYSSRQQALEARDRLPAQLRDSGVWPRHLAEVQKAVREGAK